MRCTPIVTGLVLSSIVFATVSTQAQVSIDVSKITYYNAKRNNKIIDLESLEDNVSKVKNYCYDEKNFKVPIMKAVETVLGK